MANNIYKVKCSLNHPRMFCHVLSPNSEQEKKKKALFIDVTNASENLNYTHVPAFCGCEKCTSQQFILIHSFRVRAETCMLAFFITVGLWSGRISQWGGPAEQTYPSHLTGLGHKASRGGVWADIQSPSSPPSN